MIASLVDRIVLSAFSFAEPLYMAPAPTWAGGCASLESDSLGKCGWRFFETSARLSPFL